MHRIEGPGTYILVISMRHSAEIEVGRLGQVSFPAGYFLYVGSALGGLAARLARHMSSHKRLHWHIDHVLGVGRLVEIWYRTGAARCECEWAKALEGSALARPFHAPLGASDCSCRTHLFHSQERPSVDEVQALIKGGEELESMPVSAVAESQRAEN